MPPAPPGLSGRGFAVSAGLDPGLAAELAATCERLGYASLWSNDHAAVGPPSGSALETLAALAAGTPALTLGVGALPLDRHSPAAIAAAVERSGIDPARLTLAVGAGRSERPLEPVARRPARAARRLLPETPLLLAALGPRMCELGGAAFDGVLVAWMTPPLIAAARERLAAGAAAAGRAAAAARRLRPRRRRRRCRDPARPRRGLRPRPRRCLGQALRPARRRSGPDRRFADYAEGIPSASPPTSRSSTCSSSAASPPPAYRCWSGSRPQPHRAPSDVRGRSGRRLGDEQLGQPRDDRAEGEVEGRQPERDAEEAVGVEPVAGRADLDQDDLGDRAEHRRRQRADQRRRPEAKRATQITASITTSVVPGPSGRSETSALTA